ncbi:hypothetical protein AB0H87_37570, partial [Asanoa sp. NPDC050611]
GGEQVTDGFGFASVPGARVGAPAEGYAYVVPDGGSDERPEQGAPGPRPQQGGEPGREFGFPLGRGGLPAAGSGFGPARPASSVPTGGRPRAAVQPVSGYGPGGPGGSAGPGGFGPTGPGGGFSPAGPGTSPETTEPGGFGPTSPSGFGPTSPGGGFGLVEQAVSAPGFGGGGVEPVPGRPADALSGQAGADEALVGGTAEVPAVPAPRPPHGPGEGRMRNDDGGIT